MPRPSVCSGRGAATGPGADPGDFAARSRGRSGSRAPPRGSRHGLRAHQLRSRRRRSLGPHGREYSVREERDGRSCRVLMDIAGPKCRVTSVSAAPKYRIQRGDRLVDRAKAGRPPPASRLRHFVPGYNRPARSRRRGVHRRRQSRRAGDREIRGPGGNRSLCGPGKRGAAQNRQGPQLSRHGN